MACIVLGAGRAYARQRIGQTPPAPWRLPVGQMWVLLVLSYEDGLYGKTVREDVSELTNFMGLFGKSKTLQGVFKCLRRSHFKLRLLPHKPAMRPFLNTLIIKRRVCY